MVRVIYVYVDTVFGFYQAFLLGFFFSLLSWMFQHDCLDTCCLECLVCMCFGFAPVQHMFYMDRRFRNMLFIIIVIYYYLPSGRASGLESSRPASIPSLPLGT